MANALGEFLGGVASAIREMTDIPPEVKMKPAEFADKIRNIEKGVDVSGVTATAGDVLEGKSIVDANGNVVEGTMPNRTGHNGLVTPNRPSFPIEKGYHDGNTKISAMSTTQTVTPRKEEIIVNGDYYDGSTGSEVKGQYFLTEVTVKPIPDQYQDVSGVTATADDVRSGKVFVDAEGNEVEGALSGTIADVSEVTATADDVLEGKIIVDAEGNKVTGTLIVKETVENVIWGGTSSGVSNSLAGNGIVRYVTFMNHDGSVEYGKKSVIVGEDCVDPVAAGHMDTPTRESTAQYNYTFSGGWATVPNGGKDANALKAVNEDRTVYANYVSAVRYYTITFYDSDGTTVLTTKSIAYGSVPSYTPEKDGHSFIGWSPELVAVTGNASYSAQWEEKITFANGSWADIVRISEEGNASEYFKVGDTKTITFSGRSLTLAIAGFNHDDLADGSGKAGMTIVNMTADSTTLRWRWEANDAWCYYNKTDIRTDLEKWINSLPSELISSIKSVSKDYDTTRDSGAPTLGTIECKLFLLSLTELGGKPTNEDYISVLGKRYELFPDLNADKAPTMVQSGTTTKVNYWLRNINRGGQTLPIYITTSGSRSYVSSTNIKSTYHHIRFGFCI